MIGEFAALGAAISWTVSALLYRKALLETRPLSANIIRLTLTGVVLLIFLVASGTLQVLASLPTTVAFLAAISGIIGLGFGDTLYMISLKIIGVARAVPVTCTYPLFNLVWVALAMNGSVTWSVALSAVIIIAGIWLLSLEEERSSVSPQRSVLVKGLLVAVVTALLWSVSIALMDIAVEETPNLSSAFAINCVRIFAVAASFAFSAPLLDKNRGFLRMRKTTVATLLVGGIVALGLGWFLLTYSFIYTSAARAVPISSATPLFSTLGGIFIFHEKVSGKNILGSVVIVVGIFIMFLV